MSRKRTTLASLRKQWSSPVVGTVDDTSTLVHDHEPISGLDDIDAIASPSPAPAEREPLIWTPDEKQDDPDDVHATTSLPHLPTRGRTYVDDCQGSSLADVASDMARPDGSRPSPLPLMNDHGVPSWLAASDDARVQRAVRVGLAFGGLIRAACSKRPSLDVSDVVQQMVLEHDDHADDAALVRSALHQFADQEQRTTVAIDAPDTDDILDACIQALQHACGDTTSVRTDYGPPLDTATPYVASTEALHAPGRASLAARFMMLPASERATVREDAHRLIGAHDTGDDVVVQGALMALGARVTHTLDDDKRHVRTVTYADMSGRASTPRNRLRSIVHAAERRVASASEDAHEYQGSTPNKRRKHARACARIPTVASDVLTDVVRVGRVKHARTRPRWTVWTSAR